MPCIQCSCDLPDGARFCPECGTAQPLTCPACGTAVTASARFCHECGQGLQARPQPQQSPPLTAAETPRTAASPPVRRVITVLFCDLIGSVEMSRRLDPEDLRDVVRDYRDACTEVIARHSGFTAQFHGDGIVAYFGHPTPQDGDAHRAVQAGLDLIQAITRQAPGVQQRFGTQLAVRVAVHTGPVILEAPDGPAGTARLAIGDTPHFASCIQHAAAPNSLVISRATQRLVADQFLLRSLGLHPLKGLPEPVEILAVEGSLGTPGSTESHCTPAQRSPCIGRASLIATLAQAWLRTRNNPGQALLLIGKPGIGKSRLLAEFRASITQDECRVLEGFCSPYYSDTPLYPMVLPLRTLLGLDDLPPAAALARLERVLSQQGCDLDPELPLLARFLGIPPEAGYRAIGLHPLTQKHKLMAVLLQLLTGLATQQPALLVLEDLHWVDATTLELIGLLLPRLASGRLMLVLTARPGLTPAWLHHERVTLIPVRPLSADDTEALIRRVAGGRDLPREVLQRLQHHSDGNPLYIEEMSRLFGSECATDEISAISTRPPPSGRRAPATLQDLLISRLERIPQPARRVIQLGACIGQEWSFDLLCSILPEEEAVLSAGLTQLLDEGLLYTAGSGFAIKHALIQEVSYESLPHSARRHAHERIALALQRSPTQAFPERIAQHWTKAGRPELALPFWLEAGQHAVASSAMAEAENHLRHGLEAAAALPESLERDQFELALLSSLGVALTLQKGWASPELAEIYERAQGLATRLGPTPSVFWVVWGMWAFYLVKGDQRRSLTLARQLADIANGTPGLALEASFAQGLSLLLCGHIEAALPLLESACEQYTTQDHHPQAFLTGQDVGVAARTAAALAQYLSGRTRSSLRRSEQALRLASELRHPFSRAYALGMTTWLDATRRDAYSMAMRAAETIEFSDSQSIQFWSHFGTLFAGFALVVEGQPGSGLRHLEESLALYRSLGSGCVVPHFLTLLAETRIALGQPDEALACLAEARELIATSGEALMAAEIDRLDARIRIDAARQLGLDGPLTVLPLLTRAIDTARAQGNRLFELRALTELARLSLQVPDADHVARVRQALAEALRTYPDTDSTPDLALAQATLAALPG